MSQFDIPTIDGTPATGTSGTTLATWLNQWIAAVETNHSGAARPSYAVGSMSWIKTVSATAHEFYYFDGTDDILLGTFDTTNNRFSIPIIYNLFSNNNNAVLNPVGTPPDGMSWDRANNSLVLSRSAGAALNVVRHGSDGTMVAWFRNNAQVGGINITTTATTYATTSDYRLKYDVERIGDPMEENDIPGPLGKLMKLQPSRYRMYADDGAVWHYGFIAHELQEHAPHAVTGFKDAMQEQSVQIGVMEGPDGEQLPVMGTKHVPAYQGVDTSQLIAMLVASVQQLTQKVRELENANV